MRCIKKVLLVFALLFVLKGVSQKSDIQLHTIVTDSARIFTPNQLQDLKTKLINFESETTNQLVILTIRELGYETIETYANTVFNKNKLGQKDKDNGILILFSNNDREVRIEVGYGLEPQITDAIASRIIRNTMIPKFKEERYFDGIDAATDELIFYLNDPATLEELKAEIAAREKKNKKIGIIFMFGFLSLFVGTGGFFFYKSYKNLIETFRGILVGKIGFFHGLLLIPTTGLMLLFGLIFMLVPLVIGATAYGLDFEKYKYLLNEPKQLLWLLLPFFGITILIALIKIRLKGKEDLNISWFKTNKSYMRKTFSSSGSHSFGSSSGGSSSSFSGGGGSSGGGGASGSW